LGALLHPLGALLHPLGALLHPLGALLVYLAKVGFTTMLDAPAVKKERKKERKSEVQFKKASAVEEAPESTLLSNGGRPLHFVSRKAFN
jgi:hypothetical protein